MCCFLISFIWRFGSLLSCCFDCLSCATGGRSSSSLKWCLKFFLLVILTILLTQIINLALDEYIFEAIGNMLNGKTAETSRLKSVMSRIPIIRNISAYESYWQRLSRVTASFLPFLKGINFQTVLQVFPVIYHGCETMS